MSSKFTFGIRQKLIAGISLVILVLSIGMSTTLFSISEFKQLTEEVVHYRQSATINAVDVVKNLGKSLSLLDSFLLTGEQRRYQEFRANTELLESELKDLYRSSYSNSINSDTQPLERAMPLIAELKIHGERIYQLQNDHSKNYPGIHFAVQNVYPIARQFLREVNLLIQDVSDGPLSESQRISLYYLNELRHSWAQMMSNFRLYLASRIESDLDNVHTYAYATGEWLADLELLIDSNSFTQTGSVSRLIGLRNEYLKMFPKLVGIMKDRSWRMDANIMNTTILPLVEELESVLDEFTQNQLEATRKAGYTLTSKLTGVQLSNSVMLFFGLFIAGIVAAVLIQSLVGPVEQLTAAADQVAHGDLTAKVSTNTYDELGELGKHFNEMVRRLHTLLKQKDEIAEALLHEKEHAEHASRAKSDFLSRMSHELRTPMNAILGFAQLLETDEEDPLSEEQRDQIVEIHKAGDHLLQLINEILDLSRIEAGKLSVHMEVIPTLDLVNECLLLMKPQAELRHITLNTKTTQHRVCHLLADRVRAKQALINLISNAIKYNREGGAVEVRIEPSGGSRCRILVADTGEGISPEEQELLFQPFERLTADTSIEGAGIGLAVTKRLVEHMGGNVGVESEVGQGSTFWIEFNLAKTAGMLQQNGGTAGENLSQAQIKVG